MGSTYKLTTKKHGHWCTVEKSTCESTKAAAQLINIGLSMGMCCGIEDFAIVEDKGQWCDVVFLYSEDNHELPISDLAELSTFSDDESLEYPLDKNSQPIKPGDFVCYVQGGTVYEVMAIFDGGFYYMINDERYLKEDGKLEGSRAHRNSYPCNVEHVK